MPGLKWNKISDKKPNDGQECLTTMKHGTISGIYNASEDAFFGYYWHDMEWSAYKWVPIEDLAEHEDAAVGEKSWVEPKCPDCDGNFYHSGYCPRHRR